MNVKANVDLTLLVMVDVSTPDKPKVIDTYSISDMYNHVVAYYPAQLLTMEELIEWGEMVWGKERVFSKLAPQLDQFNSGMSVSFESEAKDLPHFKNVQPRVIETTQTCELDL
jgi:hypothetical protein